MVPTAELAGQTGEKRARPPATLGQLLWFSIVFGTRAFGGMAMVAYLREELVDRRGWLSAAEFNEHLALCQVIPGATVVELLALSGYQLAGAAGAVFATAGVLLSPFTLMVIFSWLYFTYGRLPVMVSLFQGLGAVVLAIMVNGIYQLWRNLPQGLYARLVALTVLAANLYRPWPLSILVASLALVGALSWKLTPKTAPAALKAPPVSSLQLEKTPESSSAQRPAKLAREEVGKRSLVWSSVVLWTLLLLLSLGPIFSPRLRALFFAFLPIGTIAFGGGMTMYGLLQQVAVEARQWVSLLQFRDGVALGQLTPGPIMITASFIGYHVQGFLGALYATVGIFGPAPLVAIGAKLFQDRFLRHPVFRRITLTIVAGFLGFLGLVVWRLAPVSLGSWPAIALALTSFWLLRFRHWDVLPVVGVGAVLSLFLFRF